MSAEATVGPVAYLVAFVADPAGDPHADAMRELARHVAGAGFFDGGEEGAERTVGAYVAAGSVDDPGARALLAAAGGLAKRLGVRLEVQHAEIVLGELGRDGRPDARLAAALGGS
jgi:hypothetical protein